MRRWGTAAAAIVLATVLASTALGGGFFKYYKELGQYTKRRQEYSVETFRADILWGALFLTPRARGLIWERESWITEKNAEVDSKIIPAAKVQGTQFVIGLYAPEGTEKFELGKDSFWQLKLEKDGEEYTPVSIDPLPNDVLVSRLVPFTHRWANLYLVTYAGDFAPPLKLRMVGDSAKSVITWNKLPQ